MNSWPGDQFPDTPADARDALSQQPRQVPVHLSNVDLHLVVLALETLLETSWGRRENWARRRVAEISAEISRYLLSK